MVHAKFLSSKSKVYENFLQLEEDEVVEKGIQTIYT